MKEIWKMTEYDNYMVSNLGNIKSLYKKNNNPSKSAKSFIKGHVLSPNKNKGGYLSVLICNKGKKERRYVHRLVANAFIPNPENRKEVNHKNGIKTDNRVENLEWVTRSYNEKHKLIKLHKKRENHILCVETGDVFKTITDIQKITGLSAVAISNVLRGKAKTSAGYHWKKTNLQTTKIDCSKYRLKRGWKSKLAKKLGIKQCTFYRRLNNGWSMNDIKNLKPNHNNRVKRITNEN